MHEVSDARVGLDEAADDEPGDLTGGAAIVERGIEHGRAEVVLFLPPVTVGKGMQVGAQGLEQRAKAGPHPFSKDRKEIVMRAMLKQGDLELKKRILPWVHVHGMNASGIIEKVVERIAPGAGDHDHRTGGIQLEHFAVEPGIFPTGIINQTTAVDLTEEGVVRTLLDSGL